MKSVKTIFFALLVLSAFLPSCTEKDNQVPGFNSDLNKNSQIASVEASLETSLVKKFTTISDNKGNSVTLMLASQKSELVDDFLSNIDISIEILASYTPTGVAEGIAVTDNLGTEEKMEDANGLMLEVVSKTFGETTKAFTLKFEGKNVAQDGKAIGRGQLAEYESQLFIEGFKIDYLSFNCNNGCNDDILVEHWSRACALCSYKLFASHSMNPGEHWESCNDARRTKCKIFGSWPLSFYSWNFTFWNCA